MSPQDDNFAMEAGRQPITFENPLYATAPGVSGDPAVIHATQVPDTYVTKNPKPLIIPPNFQTR